MLYYYYYLLLLLLLIKRLRQICFSKVPKFFYGFKLLFSYILFLESFIFFSAFGKICSIHVVLVDNVTLIKITATLADTVDFKNV